MIIYLTVSYAIGCLYFYGFFRPKRGWNPPCFDLSAAILWPVAILLHWVTDESKSRK